jgi:hypothetical protein
MRRRSGADASGYLESFKGVVTTSPSIPFIDYLPRHLFVLLELRDTTAGNDGAGEGTAEIDAIMLRRDVMVMSARCRGGARARAWR